MRLNKHMGLQRNGRHLAEVRRQKSALYMATSHFYHDSYFRRFRSVYKLTLLLVTFDLRFITSKLQRLQQITVRFSIK